MRPSEFEAIRPNLQRAVDAINADFEKTRQSWENAKELKGAFDWAAVPEGAPSTDEAKAAPRSYTGKPARSCPLIEWAYPWRHSAERAARDLYDCGWTKEAEAIAEVLSDDLPTGPVDGNQPEIMERQLDAIRAAAEQVRTILTTCLEEQPPAAKPFDAGGGDGTLPATLVFLENPGPDPTRWSYNLDCRCVNWYGQVFTFTPTQAACFKVLAEVYRHGVPDLGEQTILECEQVESSQSRLAAVFDNGRHPAWGTMIKSGSTKGTFRLAKPGE